MGNTAKKDQIKSFEWMDEFNSDSTIAYDNWHSWLESEAKIGAWSHNVELNRVWWSPGVYEIFDLETDSKIIDNRSCFDDLSYKRLSDSITRVLCDGGGWDLILPINTKEGNKKIIRSKGKMSADNASLIVGTCQDVTKLIEGQRKIQRMQKETMGLSKLAQLGELISGVTHEIANPLSVIELSFGLMKKRLIGNEFLEDEKNKSHIARIETGLDKMKVMLKSFKKLVRFDVETMELFDINEKTKELTEFIESIIKDDGINLYFEKTNKPVWINFNSNSFDQVLMNLIYNAKDAMSLSEDKRILVKIYTNEEKAFLEVHDSGKGIREENREKIFETFFTTKEEGKGSGLGLRICKRIVDSQEGIITLIDSDLGGAAFLIEIPLASDHD